MSLTIGIPTFNRAGSLEHTLATVRLMSVPAGASCELLVVDNGSTDSTPDVVSAAAANCPFAVRHVVEERQGLCFARNRALEEARGNHVIFLDDDVEVAPTWLEGYVRAQADCKADCVVGPVFPVFPKPLPPYANDYILSRVGSNYSRKGDVTIVLKRENAHEVPGCNFGVQKQMALSLGGFDNTLDRVGSSLLGGGDFEFGIRLVKAGKTVAYEPACAVRHLIPASKLDQAYLRRRADGHGRTRSILRRKHGPKRRWLTDLRRVMALHRRWFQARLSGDQAVAFEWELRTRELVREVATSVRLM